MASMCEKGLKCWQTWLYGALDTPAPAKVGEIKAKILLLHGAEDGVLNAQVEAFKEEMRKAQADWQIICYGGAVRSFMMPEAGEIPPKVWLTMKWQPVVSGRRCSIYFRKFLNKVSP